MNNNHFYFCITNNDEAINAAGAMGILDFDAATHDGVSELFYGFRHHGRGYTIEGYVAFGVNVGDDEVQHLLHGFEVRRYNFSHHAYVLHGHVTEISLFTKHGVSWDYDYVNLVFEWHHQNMLDYYNQDA